MSNVNVKITKDGFAWNKITPTEAKVLFETEAIYRLYEDDSEALLESENEIDSEGVFGTEIGFV